MRAVSVDVSESTAVGGLLVPGCHVDIICTMSDEKSGVKVTRTVVENTNVLAVGQRLSSSAAPVQPGAPEAPMARTVTVLVGPKEAEAIELATSLGRARLVLRGSLDVGTSSTSGLTVGELLGMSEQQPAASAIRVNNEPTTRPIAQKWTIEVFKDGVRSSQQVDQPRTMATEITNTDEGPASNSIKTTPDITLTPDTSSTAGTTPATTTDQNKADNAPVSNTDATPVLPGASAD